jgi:hypothetical protein
MAPTNPYKTNKQSHNFTRHIEVSAKVMVEKLVLSSLTYAKTHALNPHLGNTSFTCSAMVGLNASKVGIFTIKIPKRMV